MKKVTLHASKFSSEAELHDALAKALDFPEHYGKNLDALYDCLTDICDDTQIIVANPAGFLSRFDLRGPIFLRVLINAAEQNKHLNIILAE